MRNKMLAVLPALVSAAAPVQLIIDTDLGFDVDDVGAIAVGHALADQGHVDLLGIVCNTGRDSCIVGVDIINHYYNRANMSIGSFKGRFVCQRPKGPTFPSLHAPTAVSSAAAGSAPTRTTARTGTMSTT